MTKTTKIIAALGVAAGLGIAALPSGAIFADQNSTNLTPFVYGNSPQTAEVTVQLTVGEAIALAVDSICSATASMNDTADCTAKVAAGTNSPRGFKIELNDKDANLNLVGANTSATIGAVGGALTAGTAGWNISGGSLTANTAIVASDATPLLVHTQATAGVREVDMTYNFATAADQAADTYSDIVVYTATVNPSV